MLSTILVLESILNSSWWLGGLCLTILMLSLISFSPLDLADSETKNTIAFLMTRLRRMGLLLLCILLILPLPLLGSVCSGLILADGGCAAASQITTTRYSQAAIPFLSSLILGKLLVFSYNRYWLTYYSHYMRKLRFKVSDEKLSDIRDVAGRLKPKNYLPAQHYKLEQDKIFIGLSESDEPVYLDGEKLRKTHAEIIGPTGVGKGIVVGVILDQLIAMNRFKKKGNVVIAIMPKQDLYLPHIMKQQAEASGCRFMFFDMSPNGVGQWSPFSGGNKRERRSRVMSVLGMGETGKLDDFYKLGEKSLIDELLANDDFSVKTLRTALENMTKKTDGAKRSIDTLKEIELIDTFNCKKDRGLKLEHILTQDKPTILYVNSSLTDNVIIKMTKAFILEITQLAISLKAQGERPTHLTLFCDELRFLISDEFDKALATLAMYDTNVISAYQSPQDLEKVGDDNLNGPAIAHSVHVNNQIKLLYRIGEFEQATWAAGQTGQQYKTIASREGTEVDAYGAEKWGNTRMLEQKQEWYYTENLFQALPERVGVLIEPGEKSRVVYTAFVPTTQTTDFYAMTPEPDPVKDKARTGQAMPEGSRPTDTKSRLEQGIATNSADLSAASCKSAKAGELPDSDAQDETLDWKFPE
ncbi:MAG: DUF87 domain-containing protein [Pseudohongiella sp.]|nr:DUF87 domain-containing protein [Pseudohongiella sp.]